MPTSSKALRCAAPSLVFLGLLSAACRCGALPGFIPAGGAAQTDGGPEVLFWGELAGFRCALLSDGVAFALQGPQDGDGTQQAPTPAERRLGQSPRAADLAAPTLHVVRLRFEGTSPQPLVLGRHPRPGLVNRYHGRDRKLWRERLTAFEEVVYEDLWPGIDLVLRQVPAGLEYRIEAAAGVDPSLTRVSWEGAFVSDGAKSGDECVITPVGVLTAAPRLGLARKGLLRWEGPAAGGAEPSRMGSMSPQKGRDLEWATYLGGESWDDLKAVACDAGGNPVVVGFTQSVDFPITAGAYQGDYHGDPDYRSEAVIVRFDQATGQPLWSTFLGGDDLDEALAITMSPSGQAIVAGRTWSTDFPTTVGALDSVRSGPEAAIVAAMDPQTGSLEWSTLFDCASASAVAISRDGDVVIGGESYLGGLQTTPGAFSTVFNGGDRDGFLARLSADGQQLRWSTYLGGGYTDRIHDLKLDSLDCPVVVGWTTSDGVGSAYFPVTAGGYQTQYRGHGDGFVSKFSADGSTLIWSTYLGGSAGDFSWSLLLDAQGAPVVAGWTNSADFPVTAGAYQTSYADNQDATISKLDSGGSGLLWSTFLGGSRTDEASKVTLGLGGRIVICGETSSLRFPGPNAADELVNSGGREAFIAILDGSGSSLFQSALLGGSSTEDFPTSAALGPGGQLYVAGNTTSVDLPVTDGCFDGVYHHAEDGFVAKYAQLLTPLFLGEFVAERTSSGASVRWEVGAGSTSSQLRLWRVLGEGPREMLAQWESAGPGVMQFADKTAPSCEGSYWLQVLDGTGQEQWYGPAQLNAAQVPERLAITSCAPNPFNPWMTIRYSLPQATRARVSIYDLEGRLVRGLVDEAKAAGEWTANWDGRDGQGMRVASGTYVARLVTDQGARTSKATLAK